MLREAGLEEEGWVEKERTLCLLVNLLSMTWEVRYCPRWFMGTLNLHVSGMYTFSLWYSIHLRMVFFNSACGFE